MSTVQERQAVAARLKKLKEDVELLVVKLPNENTKRRWQRHSETLDLAIEEIEV